MVPTFAGLLLILQWLNLINMTQKTAYLAALLLLTTSAISQGDPGGFLKKIFDAIEQKDSTKFLQLYLSNKDFASMILAGESDEDKVRISIGSTPDSTIKKYQEQICLAYLNPVVRQIDSIRKSNQPFHFQDIQYQVYKSPRFLYPSLNGNIFFKIAGSYFQLPIKEAIFINSQWKLSDLGTVKATADTTQFRRDSMKMSPSGNFDSPNITVSSIQLTEADENHLPPPPPPKPVKKRKENQQ